MNRKLIFQGSAGEALGEEWSVNAPSIADAFRVVHANKPKEYMNYFSQDNAQGEFSVKLAGDALDEAELLLNNLKGEDIVVTPVPKGSKVNAIEKIIIAVVLIVYAYYTGDWATAADVIAGEAAAVGAGFTTLGNMAMMMGMNLMMQGITELMMKEPSTDKEEEGAMFGGPANTLKHGQPIALCYGKLMVSGTPINFGFGAYKLEPANNLVFGSDNPNAWDGEIYLAASTGSGSGGNDSGGGNDSNNSQNEDGGSGGDIYEDL
jgi:predicted phage tail protein